MYMICDRRPAKPIDHTWFFFRLRFLVGSKVLSSSGSSQSCRKDGCGAETRKLTLTVSVTVESSLTTAIDSK